MAKGPRKSVRNPVVTVGGLRKFSSTRAHSGSHYKFAKKGDVRTAAQKQEVTAKKATASSAAANTVHTSRFYTADDVKVPLRKKGAPKKQVLRKSLTPGTVVILLAGRFRGKRVVFLKQLDSGLLLVTGPYKINGVPLRRVAAAYVIATSTKIDVSKVDVATITDTFFARTDAGSKKGEKSEFIEGKKEKAPIAKERTDAQSAVDKVVLPLVKAVPNLYHYLNAKFSLTSGQKPHLLAF